ncbi:hypothetical protein [Streptomyces monomycini]|uniref:hypothetical protein n=1 Tax=Streptomyces monomycini TaxID=371720 RepID=UPI0004AA4454|nr:hypothetical protein [Streptomyces monomycini]
MPAGSFCARTGARSARTGSGGSGDLGADVIGCIVALHRALPGSRVKGARPKTLVPLNGSGGTRRPPTQ